MSTSGDGARRRAWYVCARFAVILLTAVFATEVAAECGDGVAQVKSAQGRLERKLPDGAGWEALGLDDRVCPGDVVRVGRNSRAALSLINNTILRLDANSVVHFPAQPTDDLPWLDLRQGIAYFISRVRRSFGVRTPYVNAAVEGTEFLVAATGGGARVGVFEGRVAVENAAGRVLLAGGQVADIAADGPPVVQALLRPQDSVQWALYYPMLIDFPRAAVAPGGPPRVSQSLAAYARGDMTSALNAIEDLPVSAGLAVYRAALYLAVGRPRRAAEDLERVGSADPYRADAAALKSIIALVQNDAAAAMALARSAVTQDPASAAAHMALSYAHQAHFELQEAAAQVRLAAARRPEDPVIWVRLAELDLAMGQTGAALRAARRAVGVAPNQARAHAILGFVQLARYRFGAAARAFQAAVERDQADPMARLGLGLVAVRDGRVADGRRQLELAAGLDPLRALLRSYLGKAYFEEQRTALAADQLQMAKALDPLDPTAWYYSAIVAEGAHRPVAALAELEGAIARNDNRAVYRSRLLLDQDLAVRGAELARIYADLGMQQRALAEGRRALGDDPGSDSAHRFLSDAYALLPGHEIARVSELLQAQLLQPLIAQPVAAWLADSDLPIVRGTGLADPGFNEYSRMFVRDGLSLRVSGLSGSQETWGEDIALGGVANRASFSLGQFHYESDGFRENNDFTQDIYNGLAQVALTDKSMLQVERRSRTTEYGDIVLRFDDNKTFSPDQRTEWRRETTRIGYRYSPAPGSDALASLILHDLKYSTAGSNPAVPAPLVGTLFDDRAQNGYTAELQYRIHGEAVDLIAGGGSFREDRREDNIGIVTLPPFPPSVNTDSVDARLHHDNYYIYITVNPWRAIDLNAGVSADYYDGAQVEREQTNPKLGVVWRTSRDTTLRAAGFRTLKRDLSSSQTIEPTQVAGFNQFFDDDNGADAWRYGVALDQRFAGGVYAGLELSQRIVETPVGDGLATARDREQDELAHRAYVYGIVGPRMTLGMDYFYERLSREFDAANTDQDRITYHRLPLSIRYVHPSGLYGTLIGTYINQVVGFPDDSELKDDFWLIDLGLGFRFPHQAGSIGLDVRNVFDKTFNYQDTYLNGEPRIPLFRPARTVFLRMTLAI